MEEERVVVTVTLKGICGSVVLVLGVAALFYAGHLGRDCAQRGADATAFVSVGAVLVGSAVGAFVYPRSSWLLFALMACLASGVLAEILAFMGWVAACTA